MNNQNQHSTDDVNDIMAAIMQNRGRSANMPRSQAPSRQQIARRPRSSYATPAVQPINPRTPQRPVNVKPSSPVANIKENNIQHDTFEEKASTQHTHNKKFGLVKPTLALSSVAIITLVGVALFQGPISGLLKPPSPFNSDITQKMDIPLYYPTKLPSNYKIELGSINQPEADVVAYTISNDSGKKINISLQKQPEGFDLSPLYESLTDVSDLETKFGKVKVGSSSQGYRIANILTGKSWVIITTEKDNLQPEELSSIIDSLDV